MTITEDPITFSLSYKGQAHTISLPPTTTYSLLKSHIAEMPGVNLPQELQKVVVKGRAVFNDEQTIVEMGLCTGAKIMLLGTPAKIVEGIRDASERAAARAKRDAAAHHSIRPRGAPAMPSSFGTLETLPEFRDSTTARTLLSRLSTDPAIRQIMYMRKWRVGVLKELHPARDSSILGYNQNRGHSIALRLRTDALDGFRHYPDLVRVLLHELTHMVHDDHDTHFHAMNRELNKLYKEFSGRTLAGVSGTGFVDEAPVAAFEGGAFTLGGTPVPVGRERRDVLADAAAQRLTKEEMELDAACGSARHRR
ncbi:WLM-domain-containing protein [Powellomyces hirtus]|nr:WLM-domain-containing protein [Powellomyces hirtus]